MSYVTAEEVKLKLGKRNLTDSDTSRINLFITLSKDILDQFIGDQTEGTKSEEIDFEFVYNKLAIWEFETKAMNVTTINTINGETFATASTDFKIVGRFNNRIQVKDLFTDYFVGSETDFPTFTISVVAGWSNTDIPAGIKLAQLSLIEGLFAKSNGANIIKKKIGDKELSFKTSDSYEDFLLAINIYSPVSI